MGRGGGEGVGGSTRDRVDRELLDGEAVAGQAGVHPRARVARLVGAGEVRERHTGEGEGEEEEGGAHDTHAGVPKVSWTMYVC